MIQTHQTNIIYYLSMGVGNVEFSFLPHLSENSKIISMN